MARSLLVAAALALSGCGLLESRRAPAPPDASAASAPDARAAAEGDAATSGSSGEADPGLCVHQRREDLGAPVHRERGGSGGFVRLAECTRLARIEGDERWLRVAFPEVEGRSEGWISRRYVMRCDPCEGDGGPGPGAASGWPPQPQGLCVASGATGRERLRASTPTDEATAGGGARGRVGARLTVVSYNVWELYDGAGEPRYLAPAHGDAAPAAQYPLRLAALGRGLRPVPADVLVLQEVESAAVACALAGRAWPRSGWSCWGSAGRGPRGGLPQNLAVATRLEATPRVLSPVDPRAAGPRPALELSLEGGGGLTVTGVHLKSSRGQSAHEDCGNARRRMGMAAALGARYERWSSVLVVGDFNVDPGDASAAVYDRTDDILTGRGFGRLCPSPGGCGLPTWRGARGRGSSIDLAFFRRGAQWRPGSVAVLASAPHVSRTSLGSDHLPLVVELRR